jgi:hypothetical protein
LREERARLFQEAYHDQLNSVGEIDALTSGIALDVVPGDVLWDPKLRGYQHPGLRQLFDMPLDEQITLMLSRKGRYGCFPKLPPPTPQPNCPHCVTPEIRVKPLVIERPSIRIPTAERTSDSMGTSGSTA